MAHRHRASAAALAAAVLAAAAGAAGAVNVTVSAPCVAATLSYANATTACPALGGVLASPADVGACVAPTGSLAPLAACRLPGTLLNATAAAAAADPPPPCPLCGPQLAGCQRALDDLVAAALGADPSSGGGAVAATCGALPSDVLTLTLLREQSRVTCAAAAPTRVPGRMSLAALTQCSACGVVACPPGLFCPGGTAPPEICPAGFYCPGGAAKLVCPAGYYCPDRSAEPTLCRTIASCPAGSTREVVWVPLLVCLLLLVGLAGGVRAARVALTTPADDTVTGTSSGKAAEPAAAATTASGAGLPRISVSFTDLRLTTRGNVRMDGVTGAIAAGRLTAIMGGSGAGKTTLSNLLLNKETPTSGSVAVAVAPPADDPAAFVPYSTTIGALRGGIGFVPQVDVMDRSLTVRQLLTHAAFTRLPGSWSAARKTAHVDAVLHHMGLSHVADAVVGDAAGGEGGGSGAVGGLSGGEVKATNIAIELAANPGLLVLDEPTTGLDATAAYRVMELLQLTARRGITCAAVIHQPRAEILDMVDDLILLGRGGRPVYIGPMECVADYFAEVLGYACPPGENASDFIMDVLEARYGAVKGASLVAGAAVSGGAADAAGDAAAVDVATPPPVAAAVTLVAPSADGTDVPPLPAPLGAGGVEYVASSSAFLAQLFAETWRTRGQAWVAARVAREAEFARAVAAAERGGSGSTVAAAAAVAAPLQPPASDAAGKGATASLGGNRRAAATAALRATVPPRPSLVAQTWRFVLRGLLQHVLRDGLLADCGALLAAGIVMGIVGVSGLYVGPVDQAYFFSCPPGAERLCRFQLRVALEPVTFYITMALVVVTLPAAVRSLGGERPVFWREASVGVNRLAYFVGKVAAEVPKMALLAFCFVAPLVAISHWRAPVELLWLAVFVDVFFLYAMGFAVSALFTAIDAANLFGVTVGIIVCLFSGFVPVLGNGAVWAFTRHFQRALLAIELVEGWGLDTVTYDRAMFSEEHTNPNWGRDLWVLTVTALATYVLAFAILRLNHRDKQR